MKQYHSRKDTPLIFHKFMWYFRLPLGLLGLLGQFVLTISHEYPLIFPLYCIATFVLSCICITGFTNWKPYGYLSMMGLIICEGIMLLYTAYLYLSISDLTNACTSVLTFCCWDIPVSIYYYKRKPLFYQTEPDHKHNAAGSLAEKSHEKRAVDFTKKKSPSHDEKVSLAYKCYKEDVVELIFPGGKPQANKIIQSLGKIYKLNLDTCNAKRYFDILSTYTQVLTSLVIIPRPDKNIMDSLELKHGDLVRSRNMARQVLSYCKLNMKNNDFSLDSKEDIDTMNLYASLMLQNESVAAQNKDAQTANLDDPEYGLVPNKPIYTQGVNGSNYYLNNLMSDSGEKITWTRRGSKIVADINGCIDIYVSSLPSGEEYKTLYLNMYGTSNSSQIPIGFKRDPNASILDVIGFDVNTNPQKNTDTVLAPDAVSTSPGTAPAHYTAAPASPVPVQHTPAPAVPAPQAAPQAPGDAQNHDYAFCPYCGKPIAFQEAVFCPFCGKPYPAMEPAPSVRPPVQEQPPTVPVTSDAPAQQQPADHSYQHTIYAYALEQQQKDTIDALHEAIKNFQQLPGWKDSGKRIIDCQARIQEIRDLRERQHLQEEKRIRQERKKERLRSIFTRKRVVIGSIAAIVVLAGVLYWNDCSRRDRALEYVSNWNFLEADAALNGILLFCPVTDEMEKYIAAGVLMEQEEYDEAIAAFENMGNYRSSTALVAECTYRKHLQAYNDMFINQSKPVSFSAVTELLSDLQSLDHHVKAPDLLKKAQQAAFRYASKLMQEGLAEQADTGYYRCGFNSKINTARQFFARLSGYQNASSLYQVCTIMESGFPFDNVEQLYPYIDITLVKNLLANDEVIWYFLYGEWDGDHCSLEVGYDDDGFFIQYDGIPVKTSRSGYVYFSKGDMFWYKREEDVDDAVFLFHVGIVSGDEITVRSTKNNKTYTLKRQ